MPKNISSTLLWSVVATALLGISYLWINDSVQHEAEDDDHQDITEEIVLLTPDQITASGIFIDSAKAGILQKKINSPGKVILNADRIAHLYPKVGGVAKESRKNLGEKVKSFETLAVLESQEAAEIKSNYLAALQKEKYALTVLQMEQTLYDKGHAVISEYESSLNNYSEAHLALEVSKQKLFAFGLTQTEISNLPHTDPAKLRFYELRAPFEGSILSRHIALGEYISPSQEVYIMGDLSKLWVEISLYPQASQELSKGQPIEIRDISGRRGHAELLYLGSAINDETQRIQAIASLDNTEGLWQPGTFITAEIATTLIPVSLAVTQESIQKMDGQDCIFVSNEQGFEIRPVKIGRFDDHQIEILAGINEGEQYASKNSFLLKAEHEKNEAEHMH